MSLNAPKQATFIISVLIAVVGVLAALVPLGFLTGISLWLVVIGFVLLAAGCVLPNL